MLKLNERSTKQKHSKKAQMPSFNWLFAIIIGAVILYLAVSFSGKLLGWGSEETSAELLGSFETLLNPFASISSLSKTIKMPSKVMIEIGCKESDYNVPLGKQNIKLASLGAFGKWSEFTDFPYPVYDKYIFANTLEGDLFYAWSKPFEMPFKVDELIYLTDEEYCFKGAPQEIKNEILDINLNNLKITSCSVESKEVCFSNSDVFDADCDIGVRCEDSSCNLGYVKNETGTKVFFVTTALMYGAIFSSPDTYNCNFMRLMSRIDNLCEVYKKKANNLELEGCNTANIKSFIDNFNVQAKIVKNPIMKKDSFYNAAQELKAANLNIECSVF